MTIIEAIKIGPNVRRKSWPNDSYFLNIYPTCSVGNSTNAEPGTTLYANTLGYEGLLADDWEVLIPVKEEKQRKIGNMLYNVIDKPL